VVAKCTEAAYNDLDTIMLHVQSFGGKALRQVAVWVADWRGVYCAGQVTGNQIPFHLQRFCNKMWSLI
jgi:hypothetical protein